MVKSRKYNDGSWVGDKVTAAGEYAKEQYRQLQNSREASKKADKEYGQTIKNLQNDVANSEKIIKEFEDIKTKKIKTETEIIELQQEFSRLSKQIENKAENYKINVAKINNLKEDLKKEEAKREKLREETLKELNENKTDGRRRSKKNKKSKRKSKRSKRRMSIKRKSKRHH
jgi:hypothetical protein